MGEKSACTFVITRNTKTEGGEGMLKMGGTIENVFKNQFPLPSPHFLSTGLQAGGGGTSLPFPPLLDILLAPVGS